MPPKLIALDVDGTLLDSRSQLRPATIEALDLAARSGITVVLSTGRMLSECRELLEQLPMIRYAVTCTGAQTVALETGETIDRTSLTAQEMQQLCEKLWDLDVLIQIFDDHDGLIHNDAARLAQAERYAPLGLARAIQRCHIPETDFKRYVQAYQGQTNKIHMFFANAADKQTAMARLGQLPYAMADSCPLDLEVMPAHVDKGLGLRRLAEHLGVDRSQIMAIGDGGNDAAMLRYAGLPVVMGNAPEDVKALGRWVTADNDHDGAALAIKRALTEEERN